MHYCKKCGATLPEYALFCPKCGVESPISSDKECDESAQIKQESTALTQSSNQSENKGRSAKNPLSIIAWIKDNFMPLYVILGVVSIVLLQFSTMTSLSVFGFAVTLGVFAILCALAFFAVGAIKFFTANTEVNNNKHSTGNIICFALGIIAFVYVLVTSIVVLIAASDILESVNAFLDALVAI